MITYIWLLVYDCTYMIHVYDFKDMMNKYMMYTYDFSYMISSIWLFLYDYKHMTSHIWVYSYDFKYMIVSIWWTRIWFKYMSNNIWLQAYDFLYMTACIWFTYMISNIWWTSIWFTYMIIYVVHVYECKHMTIGIWLSSIWSYEYLICELSYMKLAYDHMLASIWSYSGSYMILIYEYPKSSYVGHLWDVCVDGCVSVRVRARARHVCMCVRCEVWSARCEVRDGGVCVCEVWGI